MHELAVVIVALVLVARLIGVNTLMTNVIPIIAIIPAQFCLRALSGRGVCSKLGMRNPLTEHEAQLSRAARDKARWCPVSDFLVIYLDAIDERLLEHLDQDDELKVDAVQRLRFYARAMLDGSMTRRQVADEWADWFVLTPAFVAAHGTWELADLESDARLLRHGVEDNAGLTGADKAYLSALEVALDAYPEMRTMQ